MEHNIIISDVCENAHINTILCKKDDFMRMKDFINNRTYEEKYSNWGSVSDIKLNEGDCVTVIESFYPSHEIKIIEL